MHSIWTPTDDVLQQYPHVFFISPDIWVASVLDHGITAALCEEIKQEADDSLLKDSMIMNLNIFTKREIQHLDGFGDSSPSETGEHTFHAHLHQSNPAVEDLKSLSPILDGNQNKLSKTPTKSPHSLEVLSLNMITSRSLLSPGTLFSTSPRGMNLLLLTQSLVTCLSSIMEVPWPDSLLESIL